MELFSIGVDFEVRDPTTFQGHGSSLLDNPTKFCQVEKLVMWIIWLLLASKYSTPGLHSWFYGRERKVEGGRKRKVSKGEGRGEMGREKEFGENGREGKGRTPPSLERNPRLCILDHMNNHPSATNDFVFV